MSDRDRGRGRFATTRWSVVMAAKDRASPGARAALSELCTAYWYPLYAFARRKGLDHERAQDRTQGFFTKLLEKDTLRHTDPSKGRFRSFLLASFRNYLADERARRHTLKRGAGQPTLPIEFERGDERYTREPADALTPERAFERRWAMTVLERAVNRLREHYTGSGRQRVFECLSPYLAGDRGGKTYAETARELSTSDVAVRVAVHRMRRRYRESLLEEISETLGPEEDLESELRHLFAAVEGDPEHL